MSYQFELTGGDELVVDVTSNFGVTAKAEGIFLVGSAAAAFTDFDEIVIMSEHPEGYSAESPPRPLFVLNDEVGMHNAWTTSLVQSAGAIIGFGCDRGDRANGTKSPTHLELISRELMRINPDLVLAYVDKELVTRDELYEIDHLIGYFGEIEMTPGNQLIFRKLDDRKFIDWLD